MFTVSVKFINDNGSLPPLWRSTLKDSREKELPC
jgi:hypothetical protein